MKASAFSDAQKAFILKQGTDGVPVAEICRRAGISQAAYFNWKKKDENTRLRKLVADLSLDREMLQHVIRRTVGRRSQSSEAWSQARACGRVSG